MYKDLANNYYYLTFEGIVCDFYQRSRRIGNETTCTLHFIHKTYCMHMYSSKLWNLNDIFINKLTGIKMKRQYNSIIDTLTYKLMNQ